MKGTRAGVLLVLLTAGLLLFVMSGSASSRSFPDVGESDWFAPAVDELSDARVVSGLPDGFFHPYSPVSRAQFAAMLARAVKPPAVEVEPFLDVYSTDWFFNAVASLHAAGLVSGTTASTFAPGNRLTRQQAASLIMRAVGYTLQKQPQEGISLDLTKEEVTAWLGGFRDRWWIAADHRTNVANGYRFAIISGTADQRFNPKEDVTRAQAAGMLHAALFKPLAARPEPPNPVPAEEEYPTLSRGARGPAVTRLESRLAALAYAVGSVDGFFDEATRDAVIAFQKVEGLPRDGVAGRQVWERLTRSGTPRLRYSWGGDRVEIDLSRQVLFLVDNGAVVKVLPVSTGRSGWRTPTGHFRVERKIPAWRRSALGLLYMPSYIRGGIAIHGSTSVPAYPASHGCIRVPMWATSALYYQLPIGLPVDVYY